jgi:serine/threonine protein kinase
MTATDLQTDTLMILLTQKGPTRHTSLQARYHHTQRVATSNFNTIYAAIDSSSGRELIIKESLPTWETDERLGDLRLRLAAEGGMLCFLARQGILAPRYYDYYVVGEQAYLMMSKIPGQTLNDLRCDGGLSVHQIIWIVARLCLTVHRLHQLGYVHHDIKPLNVIRRPDGIPVLIDWGAAMAIRPPGDFRPQATFTPGFVSPDQARGSARPGNDIFALGRILDDLIPSAGRRLSEIILRTSEPEGAQYPSAAALGDDLLCLVSIG